MPNDRATAPPKPAARKAPAKAVRKAGTARGPLRSVSPQAPAPTAAAGAPIGDAGFMSPRARQAQVRMQMHKSRGVTTHAHGRAQGRRNQAKRDRR